MMKNLFNSILIKKDIAGIGVRKHTVSIKEEEYNKILDDLPEGTKIDMTIEVIGKKGSHAQLKRIHAMIRQLANDTGSTFEKLKYQVKKESGLCVGDNCKSFADCDTDELNGAIQSCIELGDFLGSNLR